MTIHNECTDKKIFVEGFKDYLEGSFSKRKK